MIAQKASHVTNTMIVLDVSNIFINMDKIINDICANNGIIAETSPAFMEVYVPMLNDISTCLIGKIINEVSSVTVVNSKECRWVDELRLNSDFAKLYDAFFSLHNSYFVGVGFGKSVYIKTIASGTRLYVHLQIF